MTEELAVFEAYSLIYEHHYASGFMVARDAFTESIGNTVPVVDEKDRDTIIGKAILSSDDKGLIANVTLFDINKLNNESVCLDTFVTYDEEPKRNQTGPAIITKGKARGIVIHPAGTIPEHPSVKVKSLDDTLRPKMTRKTTITMSEKEWHKVMLGAYTGKFPKLLVLKFKIIELIHSFGGMKYEKETIY